MSRVVHRPVRIHALDEGASADARRPRRFDYASLVPRRQPREDGRAPRRDDQARDEADEDVSAPHRGVAPVSRSAGLRDTGNAPLGDDALSERITHASAPIVEAVFAQQTQFMTLIVRLAQEVAAFCGNRAVARSGTWEVTLPLDPSILPRTTLHVSLSLACLTLRFDTREQETKDLLLHHTAPLRRELDALMRAWGEPREIEIEIW